MFYFLLTVLCVSSVLGDVAHLRFDEYDTTTTTTPQPPPHPYSFSYEAGRAPGHIDRSHSESSDGSGVVIGKFSYVDPNQQTRTVDYVADHEGFHAQLSHEPQHTEAVKKATERHHALFQKISEAHANPDLLASYIPRDSAAVANAKNRHATLFEKIAAEHARIGAEHEAERLAFEATSEINELGRDEYKYEHY